MLGCIIRLSSFDNEPEVAMEVDIVVVRQRIAPFPQHTGFPDVSLIVTVFVFLLLLLLLGALIDRVVLVVCIAAGASLRLVVVLVVHIVEGAFVVHITVGASLRLVVVSVVHIAAAIVIHIAAGAFVVYIAAGAFVHVAVSASLDLIHVVHDCRLLALGPWSRTES
jgi:hypothetical protein